MPLPVSTLELRGVAAQAAGVTLREVSRVFEPRIFHALSGDASCSLLLRIAGLIEAPDSGDVLVDGASTSAMTEQTRSELRNRHFGYLYHAPYLLPAMTVLENVAVPLFKIAGVDLDEARTRTSAVLEFTGLLPSSRIPVGELPWSDQLRVALARALVHHPAFLIAEHPLAAPSADAPAHLFSLLREVPRRFGVTVLAIVPECFVPRENERWIAVESGVVRDQLRSIPETEVSRAEQK